MQLSQGIRLSVRASTFQRVASLLHARCPPGSHAHALHIRVQRLVTARVQGTLQQSEQHAAADVAPFFAPPRGNSLECCC